MGFPWLTLINITILVISITLFFTNDESAYKADFGVKYQEAYALANKECATRRLTFECVQPTDYNTYKAVCVTTSPYRRIEVPLLND